MTFLEDKLNKFVIALRARHGPLPIHVFVGELDAVLLIFLVSPFFPNVFVPKLQLRKSLRGLAITSKYWNSNLPGIQLLIPYSIEDMWFTIPLQLSFVLFRFALFCFVFSGSFEKHKKNLKSATGTAGIHWRISTSNQAIDQNISMCNNL